MDIIINLVYYTYIINKRMKKGRTVATQNRRDKRQKFVELAEKRTQRVLDSLESLGNLAAPYNYEYSEKDYKKIIRAIRAATNQLQIKFEGKEPQKKGFTL